MPAQSLYPFSHPPVLSRFPYLAHNHPHTPCHAESGGFPLHVVAEPVQLSLSVLQDRQWLDVLPSTWASVSVEVLPLQYSFATGHFGCVVYCARYRLSVNGTQHDASTIVDVALSAAAACSSTVSAEASACPSRTLVCLSVCVRYSVVFSGFLLFGTGR